MKTLQEIKDEVCVSYGYRDYDHFNNSNTKSYDLRESEITDTIAERYATEKARESVIASLEKAAENAKVTYSLNPDSLNVLPKSIEVWKSSITSEENIIIK